MKKRKPSSKSANNARAGFTIIEFTIATAIIASIAIAVALIINSISAVYQKGLALKAVNNVGRNLVDEFTAGINAAPNIDVNALCASIYDEYAEPPVQYNNCVEQQAQHLIFQERTDNITIDGESRNVQIGGVLCTGKYSYIWNTYYGLHESTKTPISFSYNNGNSSEPRPTDSEGLRLIRVEDSFHQVCKAVTSTTSYASTINTSSFTGTISVPSIEDKYDKVVRGFLNGFDLSLYLYELTFFPIAQSYTISRTFFSGSFTLGTSRGDAQITRTSGYCDAQDMSEYNYCAINKFNFAARTAGGI